MVADEGRECLLVAGNLMDNETYQGAIKQHVDKFGKIHILVNNASTQIMCEDLKEINLDDVESTFRSNIMQMFAITKFALHHMEKGGSIINTTSTVAFRGSGGMVDYSATKGAIVIIHAIACEATHPKGHPGQRRGSRAGSYTDSAGAATCKADGGSFRETTLPWNV